MVSRGLASNSPPRVDRSFDHSPCALQEWRTAHLARSGSMSSHLHPRRHHTRLRPVHNREGSRSKVLVLQPDSGGEPLQFPQTFTLRRRLLRQRCFLTFSTRRREERSMRRAKLSRPRLPRRLKISSISAQPSRLFSYGRPLPQPCRRRRPRPRAATNLCSRSRSSSATRKRCLSQT